MTSLLLNEQSWLALLYFVVLPLLAVGIAVASVQRKDRRNRREATAVAPPAPTPEPVDPTPMAEEPLPPPARPVVAGERILAITPTPFPPSQPPPTDNLSDSEAIARLATAQAHLHAAKSRLEAQDQALDATRAELEETTAELEIQRSEMVRMERRLAEQQAQLEGLRNAVQEAETLRQKVEELQSGRVTTPMPAVSTLVEDDLDDDEIVVPMPASAAEEFDLPDLDETEEHTTDPTVLGRNRPASDEHLLAPSVLDRVSMAFDGTTDSVVIEPSFGGLSNGAFTLEAWIRPTTARLPRAVLSYAVAGSSRVVLSAGGPRPSLGVQLDGHTLPDDLEPRLIADVWQHIGVSWEREDGRLTVYLDGSLAFTGEMAPGARVPAGGRLILGQEAARGAQVLIPGRAYEGSLAEVRVWSHVRSPSEVQRDTHRRVSLQEGLDVWRLG